MLLSGNQTVKNIDAFKGTVDITDDFHSLPETVKFSVGGYFGVHADYTRISGKKLISSNTTNGGSILSVHQLAFSDRAIVVHHSSTGYYASTVSELAGLRTLNTSSTILGPIIPPP